MNRIKGIFVLNFNVEIVAKLGPIGVPLLLIKSLIDNGMCAKERPNLDSHLLFSTLNQIVSQ